MKMLKLIGSEVGLLLVGLNEAGGEAGGRPAAGPPAPAEAPASGPLEIPQTSVLVATPTPPGLRGGEAFLSQYL